MLFVLKALDDVVMPRMYLAIFGLTLMALAPWQGSFGQIHERGRELAETVCSSCHLQPDPDILSRRAWTVALAYMGFFLGMDDTSYLDSGPQLARNYIAGRKRLMAQDGVLVTNPVLEESDWQAIRSYYIESAPESPLPQEDKPKLAWELPQFSIVESEYRSRPAVTTLVHINEDTNDLIIGDSDKHTLAVLDSDGQLKGQPWQFGSAMMPVDIEIRPGFALVASIGDLYAAQRSEDRPGLIARITPFEPGSADVSGSVTISGLYRMADMELADLNDDNVEDLIISGFGANNGSVSWFESRQDGGYEEHILIDRPGALRTQVHDFNDDGFLDIAVLMSHAREGFYILLNDGQNNFEPLTVFETHPGFGHTYFELLDFNNDGRLDVMTVNGDNVDSDPYNTLRNYHGIRIFLNEGNLQFRQAYFYPMYGAFGARAADFDKDGDLDIAAIAFYPDFRDDEPESFVYLENTGDLDFEAYSSESLNRGRWLTLDVGDIDGDGDVDIALGGGHMQVGMLADLGLWREMVENAPSVLILKNIVTAKQ